MILITTKFEIRFLNFEDYDPLLKIFRNKLDKETFLIQYSMIIAMMLLMIAQSFRNYKGVNYFLMFEFLVVSSLFVIYHEEFRTMSLFPKKIAPFLTLLFGFSIFCYIFNYWFEKIEDMTKTVIEAQSIYKHIFDYSKESILMITNDKPEYVNDAFLMNFKILFVNVETEVGMVKLEEGNDRTIGQ